MMIPLEKKIQNKTKQNKPTTNQQLVASGFNLKKAQGLPEPAVP